MVVCGEEWRGRVSLAKIARIAKEERRVRHAGGEKFGLSN
jgi:hypothetical protein